MRNANTLARSMDHEERLRDRASQISRAAMGLREMLLRGEFRPGERIAEIPLSAKLGVSRTPLRLAFEKLAHEGLVKALPYSGFAASEFSVDDIWDAIEARGTLEGAAARIAAERLRTPSHLEPLRKIIRETDEVLKSNIQEAPHLYLDLNEIFHSAVLELAGNNVLRRAAEQVNRLPFASPSALAILKSVPASRELLFLGHEQHREVVDAIEHREGTRAENLFREHSRVSRRILEIALANQTLRDAIPGGHLLKFQVEETA